MPAPNFRPRSKAFRLGLIDGLGAPVLFLAPKRYRYTYRYDPSLRKAWEDVSLALEESFRTECDKIGEIEAQPATRKKLEACAVNG